MKRVYEKPMLAVEHFSLTQSIAGCPAIKISGTGTSEDVLNDPSSTPTMKNLARAFYFLSTAGCRRHADNMTEVSSGNDTICYHGPIRTAFLS